MTRTMFVRVAVATVLAVVMSAGNAFAAEGTCGTTADGAVCKTGYVFDRSVSFSTSDPALCATSNDLCETGDGHQDCCASTLCTGLATGYCPYGYTAKAIGGAAAIGSGFTLDTCCERNDGSYSFPACSAPTSGGSTALQALTSDDTSWSVQDSNGFTRSLGRYVGMCFSVLVNDAECNNGDPNSVTACCTTKKPAYLQFKLPSAMAAAVTDTKRCRLSYASPVATVNALKRIKWTEVGTDNKAKFVNVPLTWKKNAKTTTVCVYSDYSAHTSCEFETMCGLASGAVPDANGNYDDGCELRIVGRRSAVSSACCTPTFAVESFDSNNMNRLANGEAATRIELHSE